MVKSGNSSRWIIIIVMVVIVVGGSWYYRARQSEKAPNYYTATVARGDIVQNVTATGVIQPVLDVLVSSQISGYINSLSANFNSKVKKGDLLCTLLPTNFEAAVASAEGDLANAKANYDLQKANLDRSKELLEKKLIAQSDYDQANALFEQSTAQVQIKTAALATARTNLSYTQILSPIDGIVIKRAVDIGNSVSASLNSPTLFEIANDLTKMQIDAAVAEADIGNVAENQDVNFTVDAYPNRQFRGKVFQIRYAPQTQQNVVIYDVMINVDNSDRKLMPGMTANASIVVARRTGTLQLANSALRFRMPEGLAQSLPPEPEAAAKPGEGAAAPATPVKQLSQDEQRQALRQIFQEAGFQRGTPATPAMIQKIQELAKQRGIEIPDRMLAMLTGGDRRGGQADAPVSRVVYRLPAGSGPAVKPKAVRIRVGITDGANTEVVSGLDEGDLIVTGVIQQSSSQAGGPAANPFGGGGGRRGGF